MTTASEVSQARLHHEATGGGGPCLLLLHGMLSSRFQWTPNLDALVSPYMAGAVGAVGPRPVAHTGA